LHQGDGAIAFYSQAVTPHHQTLPTYKHKLIGLVNAVQNWRPYLWGRPFTVRTDRYNLKFILDHRLSTISQHTWVSKLFGYGLAVEYRPGKLNGAADALPWRETELLSIHSISAPSFQLFDTLQKEVVSDPQIIDL
jgi:hypothetical protein